MAQNRQKAYVYVTGANGLTARIPADRLKQWQKAQEELKSGKRKAEPQTVERLRSLMRGKDEAPHS